MTKRPRQPRHRRRPGVLIRLTERDEDVLLALARFRLARTSDLVTYAFAGTRPDTAARRLRRLFDSRHLGILPPRIGSESVYRLGPAGKNVVAGQGLQIGRIPRGGVDHHLAIVQTWVALAAIGGLAIERCLPDWELREQFASAELRVIPDLFVIVRVSERLHAVAVEVDCGTESLPALNRKLDAYRSLWGQPPGLFGYEQFGLAAVTFASERRQALALALKNAWAIPHVLWSGSDDPRSALCKLFGELQDPLTDSPYHKGSVEG
jgi:hypothetical protein